MKVHVRPVFRTVQVALLVCVAAALPAASASAAAPTYVRLAHLSPDTPNVDVYLTSFSRPQWKLVLKGVGYGALSPYQRLEPDLYTVSMRKAGAAASTPPVISTTVRATAGAAFTVAGVGPYADLGLKVLRDDLTLPARGAVRARLVQASARAGSVDVSAVNGPRIASEVPFATTTAYTTVPAGRWNLKITATGLPDARTSTTVTLAPGAVYSLLVLDDGHGGLRTETRTDAVAPGVAPAGGVETGAGGTESAAGGPAAGVLPVGLGAGAVLLIGAATVRRRYRRVGTPRSAAHRA